MSNNVNLSQPIEVLDHGYVRFVEDWGHGDAGFKFAPDGRPVHAKPDMECGIIEAARQSTQASFRGWTRVVRCRQCGAEWECETKPAYCNRRGCLNTETEEVHSGDQRLLTFLFNNKPQHATPFEFAGMVIEVQAPIFVFREWHRHRTQSYNEMSARYAPLPDLNYVPTLERLFRTGDGKNKQMTGMKDVGELTQEFAEAFLEGLRTDYRAAEQLYQNALSNGIPKEVARLCLPVGRYSRMRASANLRNWLAFMTLRADPAAQWEIQQYAAAVGSILETCFPRTYALYVEGRRS